MKKTGVVLVTFIVGFLLLASFLIELQTVEAQPRISLPPRPMEDEPYSYGINIGSPTNTTYNSNSLILNVTLKRPINPNDYEFKVMYSIDGSANVTVPSTTTFYDRSIPDSTWSFIASYTLAKGVAFLSNLSEGSHYLTIYGIYSYVGSTIGTNWPAWPTMMHDTQTTYFTINYGIPPSIKTLQIQNATYQNSLPLNFSVDEPVSWMGYSLDEKTNVTLTGNATLNGLSYGSHGLVIYANDTVGNMGTSGNMNFTIANPEAFPTVQALPTVLVFILIAAIITAAAILLVYHKRKAKAASSFEQSNLFDKQAMTKSCLFITSDPCEPEFV